MLIYKPKMEQYELKMEQNEPKLEQNELKMEQNDKKHLVCNVCQKVFSRKIFFERHIEKGHLKIFICYRCNKTFNTSKFSLIRHMSKCRGDDLNKNNEKSVKCSICDYMNLRTYVIDHYVQVHNINICAETVRFNTSQDFESWKTEIEKSTISKFVIATKCKSAKSSVHYYRCHRDGCFKSQGKNKRNLKKLGSNKINGYCPAKMDVTLKTDTGELLVKFIGTHVGHEMELSRIPLSKSDRDNIANKLAQKVPFDEVLNNARDTVDGNAIDRLHLLKRKDLYNIERMYNLNSSVRHSSDCISVEAWIKEMRESKNYSVVRFCKVEGELNDNYPELHLDDFLLIIMNDAQLDMLKKFGNNCICVDSIHSLNKCDFELTTIMVLDDLRQGFPCLFIFSNRSNQAIFKVVFSILRDMLGTSLHPYVFMSDMADSFCNAWFDIMGPVAFRLFCTWHVVRDWKDNIGSRIKNPDKQEVMFKMLKALLEEQDETTFERMLENVLGTMENDLDLTTFKSYFIITYISNKHSWAYCYRKHSGLHRNTHLERMHETLKHIYLRGKTAKRLDKAINALMKLVRGKMDERVATLNKGKTSIKLAEIKKRHKSMETMKACSIVPEHAGESWLVNSCTGGHVYRIEVSRPDCRCELKCVDCDTCIHAYVCSCPDSSVKWNMCAHVHLLIQQTWRQFAQPGPSDDCMDDNADIFMDPVDCEIESAINQVYNSFNSEKISTGVTLTNFKAKIRQEMESILNTVTSIEQCQIAEKAMLTLKASLQPILEPPPMIAYHY